jgi:phosphatidylserine/phosphatidylglycerophosphate/cardiolipin synthase-like enzyme
MTWATLRGKARPQGLFASSYHIKVAVRDSRAIWLSSGNWQSSNQPKVYPFADNPEKLPAQFQRKYNRDYHAIIENEKLADIYEFYIRRDIELCEEQAADALPFVAPDLFVSEDLEQEEPIAFAPPPTLFKPLRIDREVTVQPLLTPDNYAQHTLALIRAAKVSIWFQNQYINLRGTEEDFPAFSQLVSTLKDKIDEGLDVRIICRDLMKQESLDILVALGFPASVFRFQPACHNKTIIVDGAKVVFGSHNWSNEGVNSNRDASLVFFDDEIAAYLADVFAYDWDRLATAHPAKTRPRIAKDGVGTPKGFRRVSYSEVFEDGE